MATSIRELTCGDVESFVGLISENAEYLKISPQNIVTAEQLKRDYFESKPPKFHCLVYEADGKLIGYALYHMVFSPGQGKFLHLRDFYVTADQNPGNKLTLLKKVIEVAKQEGSAYIELLSNTEWKLYNAFWEDCGAVNMTVTETWTQYRLTADKF